MPDCVIVVEVSRVLVWRYMPTRYLLAQEISGSALEMCLLVKTDTDRD